MTTPVVWSPPHTAPLHKRILIKQQGGFINIAYRYDIGDQYTVFECDDPYYSLRISPESVEGWLPLPGDEV